MIRTITIAEIGINHNGDIEIAKKLIDFAALSGFDYVKFQKREPELSVPEHQKLIIRDTPWGKMKYIDYKKKMEFGKKEFNIITKHCKARGIEWFTSVWDIDSVDFACKYKVKFGGKSVKLVKIPSAHITNDRLLKYARKKADIVLMSTGMSTEAQIEHAVQIGNPDVLFHTNSSYPTHTEDLNMSYIKRLKMLYPKRMIGYSCHHFGLTHAMASIYLGAKIIEKHVTLDRTMWGSDQMASVEPHGMIKLIKGLRELEKGFGDSGPRTIGPEEEVKLKALRK